MTNAQKPPAILVTGLQRTGTSVFRAVLSNCEGYFDCGEVLTIARARAQEEEAFSTFLREEYKDVEELFLPTHEQRWSMLQKYLGYLQRLHPGKILLIDVKYDFIHNFGPSSWLFTDRPLLLDFCRNKRIPVLNFTRRNLFEVYFSLQYAFAVGKWHYTGTPEGASGTTIRIKADACKRWLMAAHSSVGTVRDWLASQPGSMELVYDELYRDNTITRDYAARLAPVIGCSLDGARLPFEKTPVDYREVVENLDEVKQALSSTLFASMVNA